MNKMFDMRCIKCGRSIQNRGGNNLCRWCDREQWKAQSKKPFSSSKNHNTQKAKAKEFLLSLGCKNIKEEVRNLSGSLRFIYDVTGSKDGKIYIVECGGSQIHKLRKIMESGYILYILPYGFDMPFLYEKSMNLCHVCGNKV